ncbi:unnamed protein product [Allacma fusca]|uniref:Pre-rRNA-processing protein TSR1 homolog n=1 Tax=Allacma fusca TaxID=39272 RepID=A0A8J2KP99_9HEXA|nr:unnamed protein product [Allacma fusca]
MGRVRNAKQEVHRSGPLKQANKKHKTGRHRSKGVIDVETRGRVGSVGSISKKQKNALSRSDRRKQASAIRDKKICDIVDQKKRLGGQRGAPICIAVIPLSSSSNPGVTVKQILETLKNDVTITGQPNEHNTYLKLSNGKNVTLCVPPSKDLWSLLDVMKMSDVTLFHMPVLEPLSPEGMTLLKAAKEQGIVTPFIGTTTPFSKIDEKNFIKSASKLFVHVSKIYPLQNRNQLLNVFRMMSVSKQQVPRTWTMRSGMLIESVKSYTLAHDSLKKVLPTLPQDQIVNVIQVQGTVRRQNLNPKRTVHIAGVGDFKILRIDISPVERKDQMEDESLATPTDIPPRFLHDPSTEEEEVEEEQYADSQFDSDDEASMISETDEMDMAIDSFFGNNPGKGSRPSDIEVTYTVGNGGEQQTFPGAQAYRDEQSKKRLVPKGTSSYQADWLNDSDSEGGSLINSDDDLEDGNDSQDNMEEDDNDDEWEDEQEQLKVARAARTEAEFPDWIDTPMDIPAKVRFQRYRGLQSFKKSAWDPYENLPKEYAKIFQFQNFRQAYKKILGEEQDGQGFIPVGQRVSIILQPLSELSKGSVANIFNAINSSKPVVLFSQFRHEGKMSVMNVQLNVTEILKNKEELVFQIGCRRFQAKPILSEISTGNKHKMLRFGQINTSCMATIIAPIVFPSASVLVFKKSNNTLIPAGSGSVFSVDPTRIAVKRVLLSGYPFRSHNRKAVVRFMFFNRDDIEWFKPVELKTRYGLRGNIKEPLGTHGHMKCIFNGPVKSQDTVLMPLYKRVFPKFNYDPAVIPYNVYDSFEIRSSVLSAF